MTITKPILFDTNILVYNQDKDSPYYQTAHQWHQEALSGNTKAVLSSQNLLEFAAVMTSHIHLEKPLSPKQTSREISAYQQSQGFEIIYPNSQTVEVFTKLLSKYGLRNARQSFDIFLVATMLSNQVYSILTYNIKDFKHFTEIEIVAMEQV